jgi:phosphoribosyl-ATP pyrophosphohydrolase
MIMAGPSSKKPSQKQSQKRASSEFSRFFHHASSAEREKVFRRVAQKVNEEQREIYYGRKKKDIRAIEKESEGLLSNILEQ